MSCANIWNISRLTIFPRWCKCLAWARDITRDYLNILRRYLGNESEDLVYLDPPLNFAQGHNGLSQEKDAAAAASPDFLADFGPALRQYA